MKINFEIFSPDEFERLVAANKHGGFSSSFTDTELGLLKSGIGATLDLVLRARRVINEAQMKGLKYQSEFVERTELEGYVSRAEFRILQASFEDMMTKFFLTFRLLEDAKLVSEEKLLTKLSEIEEEVKAVIEKHKIKK